MMVSWPQTLVLCTVLLACRATGRSFEFSIPPTVPLLPYSTTAILRTNGSTLTAPISTRNTFTFEMPSELPRDGHGYSTWLLGVHCRDYSFATYALMILSDGSADFYRTSTAGIKVSAAQKLDSQVMQLDYLGPRQYLEQRQTFSPFSLLKNPIILIGLVGLGFAVGVPYLLENMDPEMRAEFEEQQRKGIFGGAGGSNPPNPLQNFDMAAWMAGSSQKTNKDELLQIEDTGSSRNQGNKALHKRR